MSKTIRIGMLGCGTVGTGVAKILTHSAELLRTRANCRFELVRVAVRSMSRPRDGVLPKSLFTTNANDILTDPSIELVVEVAGGLEPARTWIEQALRQGKDVVTANKAVLATHGRDLMPLARRLGRVVAFEAAVAGGIPVIATIRQSLSAQRVTSLRGILNGTSNYILSAMEAEGMSFPTALGEAQRLGYAEADPTLDLDGSDAAQKLALLAQLVFGVDIDWAAIPRTGISAVRGEDLRWARAHGYRLKPIALATIATEASADALAERGLVLEVAPMLVPEAEPSARIAGSLNGLGIESEVLGSLWIEGHGAGQGPTASAVVADLVDVALGRTRLADASMPLFPDGLPRWRNRSAAVMRSYYVRALLPSSHSEHDVLASGSERGIRWMPSEPADDATGSMHVGRIGPISLAEMAACQAALAKAVEASHAANFPPIWLPVLDGSQS